MSCAEDAQLRALRPCRRVAEPPKTGARDRRPVSGAHEERWCAMYGVVGSPVGRAHCRAFHDAEDSPWRGSAQVAEETLVLLPEVGAIARCALARGVQEGHVLARRAGSDDEDA
eukprot:5222146-Heterocapsa_arctica.AAC.2